jgi:hypothetical protein
MMKYQSNQEGYIMTDNILKMVPNSNNVVLNSYWFGDDIGIVLVEDQVTKKTMCYIGTASTGSQEGDEYRIAQWGSKVPKSMAESLFGTLMDYKLN